MTRKLQCQYVCQVYLSNDHVIKVCF